MLQMRPWKMSLLLEGNNNSKFQLLLTLQSSVFPSERIRSQGESEFASIGFFPLLAPLFSSSLCSPLFCLVPHHPTRPVLSLQKSIHPAPFHQQIDTPLPAHLLEERVGETRTGQQHGVQLSPGQVTALWGKCLPPHSLQPATFSPSHPGGYLISSRLF